jgi:DNA-binding NarL/FixJ family response regulator
VKLRLVLADDHPVVLSGLRAILSRDLDVAGVAASTEEAIDITIALRPDVLVADLRMPGGGAAAILRALRLADCPTRVLVLTSYDAAADASTVLAHGASGFLLKGATPSELVTAIRDVAAGRRVVERNVAAVLEDGPVLTARELEVLARVAAGDSNAAIARALFVSEATVKTHLLHVYEKLGVRDRTGAVTAAMRRGWLAP